MVKEAEYNSPYPILSTEIKSLVHARGPITMTEIVDVFPQHPLSDVLSAITLLVDPESEVELTRGRFLDEIIVNPNAPTNENG